MLLTCLSLVVASLLLAGCGGGSGSESARTSGERPTRDRRTTTSAVGQGGGGAGDFCEQLARADEGGAGDDPAKFVEALAALRDAAPAELSDDLEVLARVARKLRDLDETDPQSAGKVLALVMAPEVMEASSALERYAQDECGLDLGGSDPQGPDDTSLDGASTTTAPADGSSTDLDLEDVDAVKEANSGASWPDKLTGTAISMDTYVQVSADEGAGLTPEEALAACNAVREALVVKNPAVTVEVLSGRRTLAEAGAGQPCGLS